MSTTILGIAFFLVIATITGLAISGQLGSMAGDGAPFMIVLYLVAIIIFGGAYMGLKVMERRGMVVKSTESAERKNRRVRR
jgi:uncharacterized BrkB/YihY/UPF0761 family membrane protein